MTTFIDLYRDHFSVEFVCRELAKRPGEFLTSRGYRAAKTRKPLTTKPSSQPDTRLNLVNLNFKAACPNQLWVADITYVRTLLGFVYTAFVTDVFIRNIVVGQRGRL